MNPKDYLQKYYDELIKEIKNETIKNEATHIRDAAKEEINLRSKSKPTAKSKISSNTY